MPLFTQLFRWCAKSWNHLVQKPYEQLKSLQGDPHYIATGIAVGVFVAFTPTIPFHTILALGMAFVFKGSKPAALLGSWLSNPLTIPAFYYGSFRIGKLLFGPGIFENIRPAEMKSFVTLGWDVAIAMVTGGVLLGVIPAIMVYFLSIYLFRKWRSHRKTSLYKANPAVNNPVFDHQPLSKT